jgi:hypothetical protein
MHVKFSVRVCGLTFVALQNMVGQTDQPPSNTYYVNFPLYIEDDQMRSTLFINNNAKSGTIDTIRVTAYSRDGRAGDTIAIPVSYFTPAQVRVKDLLPQATEFDFSVGNIQLAYEGRPMQVTGQVTISSPNQHLAFESTMGMDDHKSQSVNGIVWLPSSYAKAQIALTNVGASPMHAAVKTGFGTDTRATVGPRQTKVIDLGRESGRGNESTFLLTVEHDGLSNDLLATGFVLNPDSGYSANFELLDPSTMISNRLAAAHFQFGAPRINEGYPSGTTFRAPLVIANIGLSDSRVDITVDYTIDSQAHVIQLPSLTLAAGDMRTIQLDKLLSDSGVPSAVEDAGLDLSYTGGPGTLVARLTSLDAAGGFSMDVPVKDPLAGMNRVGGSYPWRLDGDHKSVVHLKNTTDQEVRALVQIRFDVGVYTPQRYKLAPFQTIAIDVGQLRDMQTPDLLGAVIPKDVVAGKIVWWEQTIGSLIGRNDIHNRTLGTSSSFSCGAECSCPPWHLGTSYMSQSSYTARAGAAAGTFFRPYEPVGDCSNSNYILDHTSDATWSSSNTSVATVSNDAFDHGYISPLADGASTITASFATWQEVPEFHACQSNSTDTPNGALTVQCPHPVNFRQTSASDIGGGTLEFHYAYDSSTGTLGDLSGCTVGEIVTYPGGANPYHFPSPPFPTSTPSNSPDDPTVIDVGSTSGSFIDDHYVPSGTFPTPYSSGSVTATQYYRYKCACINSGGYANVLGPLSIARSVSNPGSGWQYTLTKSGSTATLVLP